MLGNHILRRTLCISFTRNLSEGVSKTQASATPAGNVVNTNVPGLSPAVILPANQPLGPGVDPKKSGAYKVPEYFCYNSGSYYEAEVELAKYRLPQPSAVKK